MSLTGILPLYKPIGMRSTACVEAVRRVLGKKNKVGHGGTLDSTASGLLLLLIGPATRLSSYIMGMPKCYETVIRFGAETTTDDAAGDIRSEGDSRHVTDDAIDGALPAFMGWRMQEPPQISAVHIDGERAHKLARGGACLPIEPKPIFIEKIERLESVSEASVMLRVSCHKGTYIRSLARDLGRRLGCGAHVQSLHRVSSGPYFSDGAPSADALPLMSTSELAERILPIDSLNCVSARYTADESQRKMMLNGRTQMLNQLHRNNFGRFTNDSKEVVVVIDGIFSICRAERRHASLELFPVTNIFYSGSDSK